MKRVWMRKAPFFILIAAAALLAFGGVTMLLWNNILHAVLHVGVITFWQAVGILFLARILFGFRGGRRHFGGGHYWKRRMFNKWNNMTPEEQEKMKAQWSCHGRDWQIV